MKLSKICFVMPNYQLSTGTHFNYLYQLIALLQKEKKVFLIIERGEKADFLINGQCYVQKFKSPPLKLLENFLVLMYVRAIGYQDFYIHYSFLSSFNASLITKILRGRVFYWNCGLPWLYQRNFLRERFERLVYRLVTFLVTGTEGLKNQYAKHYQLPLSKIKVMPNWVDVSRFRKMGKRDLKSKLNISSRDKVILFIHHLSRRKGAHYLPEIAQNLKDENVVLLIAGGGPEKNNIQSLITNYQLQDRVRFLHCVPNREIQDYFEIADMFILPSEEEGFPHVLLESMAAAVPFVAFNVGGVQEITPLELSRYLVASGNLNAFIQKIKELLHADSKNLEVLKRSELNWVQKLDIKFAMERFRNLF